MPLQQIGTSPVLIVGVGEQAEGELWLTNPTASAITISEAHLTVTLPAETSTARIEIPKDAGVPADASRRLLIAVGMDPLTPPGSHAASVNLVTSDGSPVFTANFLVVASYLPQFVPERFVFEGVASGAVVSGQIVVRNRGNVPIKVDAIAEEPLHHLQTQPRLLAVLPTGAVTVQPAVGLAAAGTVKFTNSKPTIAPGNWEKVDFKLTAPAGLAKNAHFRALPRIASERFAIDLLTKP